jgi:hypothetical protein
MGSDEDDGATIDWRDDEVLKKILTPGGYQEMFKLQGKSLPKYMKDALDDLAKSAYSGGYYSANSAAYDDNASPTIPRLWKDPEEYPRDKYPNIVSEVDEQAVAGKDGKELPDLLEEIDLSILDADEDEFDEYIARKERAQQIRIDNYLQSLSSGHGYSEGGRSSAQSTGDDDSRDERKDDARESQLNANLGKLLWLPHVQVPMFVNNVVCRQ